MISAATDLEYPHMAIAAPHVKLLRQLATAKDDYLSGAFDIAWDGGSATIFTVFGQPSHAVFETAAGRLEGQEALDALFHELPPRFHVGEWRRIMSPQETLAISLDDLAGPFALLAGEHADVRVDDDEFAWLSADDDSPDLGFGVDDFPLLPQGDALWDEASAPGVELTTRLPSLAAALVVLTGSRLRAAGVVRSGDLIDAVWVDSNDHARGETAAMALLGATDGLVAGYGLASGAIAEALPLLWRLPRGEAIDATWVDAPGLIASLKSDGADRVLLIDGSAQGVGLFSGGSLVAAYTSENPVPSRSAKPLLELLRRPGTTLRVQQRPGTATPMTPGRDASGDVAEGLDDAAVDEPAAAPAQPPAAVASDAPAEAPLEESWVDFDEVRGELIQIAVDWLGDRDSAPVTQLLRNTRAAIEDFVATIDAIRTLHVPGHDATAVQTMAREMHVHAAERLCGA